MDNALHVALSRQMMLRREMDIVANNIANSDTAGFKMESLMTKSEPRMSSHAPAGSRPINFVVANGVARDFGQGALRRTDGPLDMAIDGRGFFKVQTPDGDRFTRDGRFRTDDQGHLATQGGQPVMDEGGSEITIDPAKGQVTISAEGTLIQGTERIGKVGVYNFTDLSVLEKTGDNLLKNTSNATPEAATDASVRQGMLEGSNVQPILEISRMIEVSRAYEQSMKVMDTNTDLSRRSVERLGKAN
jgi:flagellar basal-body rod protein FlgF